MDHDPHHWRTALHITADRLTSVVSPLDADAIRGRSYDADWTIAQVMSHLGSQNEVFTAVLDAGLQGGDPPDASAFPPIWGRWDAKTPDEQVRDSLAGIAEHAARLDALTEDDLARFHVSMFGMDLDATGFLQLRLSEYALHTWDVEVAVDPTATLEPRAVPLLIGSAPAMAARLAKPAPRSFRLWTHTVDPELDLLWDCGDEVTVERGTGGDDDARIDLPAEALLRLLAGRLDAEHTPSSVRATGIDLDDVRAIFPGY